MKFIETYRGYSIFDSLKGHFLIGDKDSPDFIQLPFTSVEEARSHIDSLCGEPVLV